MNTARGWGTAHGRRVFTYAHAYAFRIFGGNRSAALHAWTGATDPSTSVREMEARADVAPNGFQLRVFPGGHFHLVEQHGALVREISEHLVPVG